MYPAAPHDEITGLVNYLDVQLSAIRAAPVGLTEDQARATPTRSALSVGGLVKHTAYGLRGAVATITQEGRSEIDAAAFAAHAASFAHRDGDDGRGAGGVRRGAVGDPGRCRGRRSRRRLPGPPPRGTGSSTPGPRSCAISWSIRSRRPPGTPATPTIREQLDGVTVPTLEMTLAGLPANQFFQPYEPAPGTIGS